MDGKDNSNDFDAGRSPSDRRSNNYLAMESQDHGRRPHVFEREQILGFGQSSFQSRSVHDRFLSPTSVGYRSPSSASSHGGQTPWGEHGVDSDSVSSASGSVMGGIIRKEDEAEVLRPHCCPLWDERRGDFCFVTANDVNGILYHLFSAHRDFFEEGERQYRCVKVECNFLPADFDKLVNHLKDNHREDIMHLLALMDLMRSKLDSEKQCNQRSTLAAKKKLQEKDDEIKKMKKSLKKTFHYREQNVILRSKLKYKERQLTKAKKMCINYHTEVINQLFSDQDIDERDTVILESSEDEDNLINVEEQRDLTEMNRLICLS